MKKFFLAFAASSLFAVAALAAEVELPNNAGKVAVEGDVVTVAEGVAIADGEYAVTVDGKEVTLVFKDNKGTVKH